MSFKEKWMSFISKMNSKGVPVPLIRDPKTRRGSVSLTLVFISFNVCLISFFGKAAGFFGGVNVDQSYNLFLASCGLYFGRKFQKDDKGQIDLNKETDSGKPQQ